MNAIVLEGLGFLRKFYPERKEYQVGNNIDLVSDCRRLRGNNSQIVITTSNHPLDCHGYTLKKYIKFLSE
tara:strand:+ start:254 stop:463 length:210 start_codon:yes stop_codon:yes gene_type:complete